MLMHIACPAVPDASSAGLKPLLFERPRDGSRTRGYCGSAAGAVRSLNGDSLPPRSADLSRVEPAVIPNGSSMDRTRDPHPIDVAVGRRIRHRRQMLGLSQTTVARRLGISFQSVQKYESGHIRVSASRLLALAEVLTIPVAYFFEAVAQKSEESAETDRASAELLRIAMQLPPDVRAAYMACMRSSLSLYKR